MASNKDVKAVYIGGDIVVAHPNPYYEIRDSDGEVVATTSAEDKEAALENYREGKNIW